MQKFFEIFSIFFAKGLDKPHIVWYTILVRQRNEPLTKGSEAVIEGMTNAEFNSFLETLAKLIESKATTVEEAAQIVREAKTT